MAGKPRSSRIFKNRNCDSCRIYQNSNVDIKTYRNQMKSHGQENNCYTNDLQEALFENHEMNFGILSIEV